MHNFVVFTLDMDFEIVVVCMLVVLYLIAIITMCLLVYMCLKQKFNNTSDRNINTNSTNSDNQEQNSETTNNIQTVVDPNFNSDDTDKSDASNVYQEIEDLYIDDSIPTNLDAKCKNNNFPEPFYFNLDPECEDCLCEGVWLCKKHLYH